MGGVLQAQVRLNILRPYGPNMKVPARRPTMSKHRAQIVIVLSRIAFLSGFACLCGRRAGECRCETGAVVFVGDAFTGRAGGEET